MDGKKEFYYGVVHEILELNYSKFSIPLFKCKWVHLDHVKKDTYNMTFDNLSSVGYRYEPFILRSQATQIFYVKDLANKNWHVMMSGKRRIVGAENVVDEDEYNQFNDLPLVGESIRVDDRQVIGERCYAREDHSDGLIYNGNIVWSDEIFEYVIEKMRGYSFWLCNHLTLDL